MPKTRSLLGVAIVTLASALPAGISAQSTYTYNSYGTPGLIDLPTAQSAEDAELAGTYTHSAASSRATLTFQITPRLSGSFRYGKIPNYTLAGNPTYDRSFDLRYRILDETDYRPAVAIGLRDLMGTGLYSSEYLVATKQITPRLTVTGGIGWGRLATRGGFKNPLSVLGSGFNSRPGGFSGTGGQVELGRWFRGQAALFGGLSYQASDRLTLKAEYSTDAYSIESIPRRGLIDPKTPVNVGLDYKLAKGVNLQLAYMQGDMISAAVTLSTNPRIATIAGGTAAAPIPVRPRNMASAADLGWTVNEPVKAKLRDGMQTLLAQNGITLEAAQLEGREATVYIRTSTYLARSEAIGKTARVMSAAAPHSIDTFRIVPLVQGVPTSAVVIRRDDLARYEHDPNGAQKIFDAAQIVPYTTAPAAEDRMEPYPRLTWSLGPYVKTSYFDPDNPVRADAGLRLAGRINIAPSLVLSGTLDHRVVGNRDESNRFSASTLPRVRTDAYRYAKAETALSHLTLASYFRPGADLYGRVTAGYLEPMFAGVSGELLWKPVDSRLALGVEVNYVKQRDFDQQFGLRNYSTTTGHVSAYYDFGNGFHGKIDAGRYLAGDWGSTLTLDREFGNGWKIGAYATFTNVSFDDFGEGSFDKGIRLEVPLEHFLGKASGKTYKATIQPLSRDGGARLDVKDRLYEQIRDYHEPELEKSWGRFWR